MTLNRFIYHCMKVPPNHLYRMYGIPSQHLTKLHITYDDDVVYQGTISDLIMSNIEIFRLYMLNEVISWYIPAEKVDIDETKILDERWMPVPSTLNITIGDLMVTPDFAQSNIRRAILGGNNFLSCRRIILGEMLELATLEDRTRVTIYSPEYETRFEGTVNELRNMMKTNDIVSECDIIDSMWVPSSYIPVMRNSDLYDPTKNYSATLSIQVDM